MSIFAFHFASGLLTEMGWPRKLGRFKSQGYDVVMVDRAFAQSMDWGAGLGAGRPRLALQMIAEIHQGDWEDGAPDIKGLVGGWLTRDSFLSAASPQQAVELPRFAEEGVSAIGTSAFSVEDFVDRRMKTLMEPKLFKALIWGLSNPDRFEAWYGSRAADYESSAPDWISHGLEIDETLPSLPEFYENSEQILREYEREVQPLPPIPPKLLADAEALGWRL